MIELNLVIALNRVVNRINKKTAVICSKYDISLGQFAVLEVLYHKGDLKVCDVREKILSTDGTISIIIKNLEKKGYISKVKSEKDKRLSLLHLEESGRKLIDEVFPLNCKSIVKEFSKYTKEEKEYLLKLLERGRQ